ncbi:MAG: hypothetical protein BHW58_07510 [Azospirillum sp. 51_20]|nr:MAG: hypothetical protein BHW58_07510 [Azospirillum sp. 51_20]
MKLRIYLKILQTKIIPQIQFLPFNKEEELYQEIYQVEIFYMITQILKIIKEFNLEILLFIYVLLKAD